MTYTGYMTLNDERSFQVTWPDVELLKAWPQKMVARPEEGNLLDVVIRNRTQEARRARLHVELGYGLDEHRTLVGVCKLLPVNWKARPTVCFYHDVKPTDDAEILVRAGGKPILLRRKHGGDPQGYWRWPDWPKLWVLLMQGSAAQ